MTSWRRFSVALGLFLIGIVVPLGAADPSADRPAPVTCRPAIDAVMMGGLGTPNASDLTCSGAPRGCLAAKL